MKNKKLLVLFLIITLVITSVQQVQAESMDVPWNTKSEEIPGDTELSENESITSKNDKNLDVIEKEETNTQEVEDSKKNYDMNEDKSDEPEENSNLEVEESLEQESIQKEILDEPKRPENLIIGDYIKSDLDYNTPVYTSDTETYSDIPSTYPGEMDDLYEEYPSTRNQNPYGTCWAFSSIGLAEFDLLKDSAKGNGTVDSSIDLSELQLAYFTYNSVLDPLGGTEGDSVKYYNENATESYLNYGGNYEMASRRLAQWCGPVNESLVPYDQASSTISKGLNDTYAFNQDEAHLQNAYLINIKENASGVKSQIMDHGAAGVMYYHNDDSFGWNSDLQKYTYYDATTSGGGHAVMIVGWDDDFSRDNFTGDEKPSENGAWLIRNSWGDYASYFWMSYETASLSDTAWIFDFSEEDGYDNNYQLDGGVQSYPDKEHMTLANIFKTKQATDGISEKLKAVSLSFTQAANVSYTIEIYTNLTDINDPYSGIKQENATTSGTTAYAGIYTIPLENVVTLQPETSFAVVVKTESAMLDYEQATSIATGENLSTMIWDCKVSQNNNSLYYSGGKFYPYYWGNYCIKAFTADEDAEPAIYQGVDYSAVYDYQYYIDNNPDIMAAFGGNRELTLAHFVNTGMNEGRQGCDQFNVDSYRKRYADLRKAFENDLRQYYIHYMTNRKNEGRIGTGTTKLVDPETVYEGIDYSPVYDYEYYIENYPDIKAAFENDDMAALSHFVNNGMHEGRQGCSGFDVNSYRKCYADLRKAFGDDLKQYYIHYITNGKNEGRIGTGTTELKNPETVYEGIDYSLVYDYEYYIENNADIKSAFGDNDAAVLFHFVNTGMSEGRQGNEKFNVFTYRNKYVDLRKVFGKNWKEYYLHYLFNGKKEGRTGEGNSQLIDPVTEYNGIDYSPIYDYEYYIENNPDVEEVYAGDDMAALSHFINNGMNEGRRGNEEFNVYTYKNRYVDLRNAFENNLKLYYLHYLTNGRKEGRSGSGTSELMGFITVYEGVDYSSIYDYNYYIDNNLDIKKAFGGDDYAVLSHFVNTGMGEGRIGCNSFNVFIYKSNYQDLQKAFGDNLRAYYIHYMNTGRNEGRSGNISLIGEQIFQIEKCIASNYDKEKITITLTMKKQSSLISSDDEYYIVLMNSRGTNRITLEKGVWGEGNLSISASFTDNDCFKAFATGKYAIAMKIKDGYQIVSDACVLKNPEIMASKEDDFKDKYWGYYEGYKVYSKKGIQDADEAYTADLGVQHVLLNADIQDLVSAGPQSGYIPYTYKGNTYYFSDLIALKNTINDLHGWGNTEGGYTYGKGISRNVTLVLLMSWKHDELSYLIHPSARINGAAPYYSLNMQEENARNTFEALFCYMGEELGQMKTRVNNWTLGNELNSCNAWNYAGSMSFNEYVANYAEAFKMLHQAVRRTAASPRLFISLDHCWNVAEAGYSGRAFLDTFASYMNQTAPDMQWNVNFHSYSQPLSNNRFWNDRWNTTDDVSTRYISMRNISVLTNYLSSLEQTYGKTQGSIRVIIGELGYSATKGGAESEQAAALGYGYYIAMANKRIDSYIIRAYVDDSTEAASGLYLGLNANWGYHVKKEAYEVYKYLDRNQSFDYMNRYLGMIGIGSWESAIPGFNADEIRAGEKMFQ